MRIIISESKAQRLAKLYVLDKLNSLKLSPEEDGYSKSNDDEFRVDFDKTSEIEPGLGAFYYVDGTLEVSPSILYFCNLFSGVKDVGDYKIIGKWFEVKYGVDVDRIWEWYDGAP
jgi:hypothetical protein